MRQEEKSWWPKLQSLTAGSETPLEPVDLSFKGQVSLVSGSSWEFRQIKIQENFKRRGRSYEHLCDVRTDKKQNKKQVRRVW